MRLVSTVRGTTELKRVAHQTNVQKRRQVGREGSRLRFRTAKRSAQKASFLEMALRVGKIISLLNANDNAVHSFRGINLEYQQPIEGSEVLKAIVCSPRSWVSDFSAKKTTCEECLSERTEHSISRGFL